MGYVMNATFKLVDQVSSVLNNIGTTGKRVIAGMEDDFVRVNSHITQTSRTTAQASASLAKLSGDISGAAAQSRLLASAMADEAEKMHKAAQNAQLKADTTERMAEMARRHYNEILKDIEAETKSENADKKSIEAMKEKASAALLETERLEKASAALRKKAEAADRAADAAQDNAQAALHAAQAEEKVAASATKTASAEKQVAEALNRSEQQAEEYTSAVRKAANESDRFGKQGESTAELLEGAFTALAVERVLVGIKNAFADCSKAAIEYESAVTGVYKTVNGTEEQLNAISNDIKHMALYIPSTTTAIAGVAESAGQLGIGTEYITDFTEVMINLDETTNLASEEAASSLAKFSNITGMAETNYENLGSTVVALGNNFATTEADIVAMATRMASAGTLAGLTEAEILGLSAAVSSVGIEAEAGGSAMSTLISEIQVAVETGNDSLNDFASVANMTAEEFQTAFKDNAANALYEFIDGLNDVERNGATATVILENMGITEIRLSNAVKALANNSEGLSGAIKLAGEAWDENTALATEAELRYGTLESRLNITRNAANNLKIAIGDVLNPVVGDFADAGTDALVWVTKFTENNPTVIAGLSGMTTALGLAAGAVAVYTVGVKAMEAVTKAFDATLSKTKIGIIIGGIATAGAAISSLVYHFKYARYAEEMVEDYNGTLMQCREEIEATEISYRNVCNMYGENSQAAQSLSAELDTLHAQYEKGGGFIADYEQRLTESKEALNSFTTEYNGKMDEIDKEWQSGLIATAQLEALSDKAQLTNADLDMMSNYADYLNDTFNCAIKVNYDTGELTGFEPENVTDILIKESEESRKQTAAETLTNSDFTNDYIEDLKNFENTKNKYSAIKSEIESVMNNPSKVNMTGYTMSEADEHFGNLLDKQKNEIEDYENQIRELYSVLGNPDGADEFIQYLQNTALGFDEVKNSAEESGEKMLTPLEAAHNAIEGQADEIYKLAEAYDEAYNAAYESFQGQFGLFDEAQMNTEATVENAQAALDSQLAYWTAYNENISYLSAVSAETLGVTQANYDMFMSYLRTGDSEAVALMNNIVTNIKNGNSEAVSEVIETFGQVDAKQAEAADKVAKWETNIEEHMNEAFRTAEQSIHEIEGLDGNVRHAAVKIIQSYANGIRSMQPVAVSAAGNLAAAVQAKFNSVNIKIPGLSSESSSIDNQYASGTLSAKAGLALVGEEGPELMMLQGGERIFNASDTAKILSNHSESSFDVSLPESPVKTFESKTQNASEQKFSIDINGKGSIDIKGGMDKEQVVEILFDYIKPVLMNILSQEIFEEGENSYEI